MRKTQILVNKPVYLGISILDLSKILMYEFWYNHAQRKVLIKSFYMDKGST